MRGSVLPLRGAAGELRVHKEHSEPDSPLTKVGLINYFNTYLLINKLLLLHYWIYRIDSF